MPPSQWYPSGLLTGKLKATFAIVILNQPINGNALDVLINDAALLVCADGGGNRLLQYDREGRNTKIRLPDAIIGDLDSLDEVTREHYGRQGVSIIRDPDQYSTDFTKSLKWIRESWTGKNGAESRLDVVVLGGLGGRVDQGFSQIHHLLMAQQDPDLLNGRVFLMSESSLTFILDDLNEVYIEDGTFEENVGIIPIIGPAKISTQGLEWDVQDWPTEFGGQVSTSNHLRANKIIIKVDGKACLFTMELANHLQL